MDASSVTFVESTAARVKAEDRRQLRIIADLKRRPDSKLCLAMICMRLVLSHGKGNIFTLAKNAGTSVYQIERFYARNLPSSAELVRNLQLWGRVKLTNVVFNLYVDDGLLERDYPDSTFLRPYHYHRYFYTDLAAINPIINSGVACHASCSQA